MRGRCRPARTRRGSVRWRTCRIARSWRDARLGVAGSTRSCTCRRRAGVACRGAGRHPIASGVHVTCACTPAPPCTEADDARRDDRHAAAQKSMDWHVTQASRAGVRYVPAVQAVHTEFPAVVQVTCDVHPGTAVHAEQWPSTSRYDPIMQLLQMELLSLVQLTAPGWHWSTPGAGAALGRRSDVRRVVARIALGTVRIGRLVQLTAPEQCGPDCTARTCPGCSVDSSR